MSSLRADSIVALLATALFCTAASCESERTNPADSPESTEPFETEEADLRLPDVVRRGVCLAHNWQEEGADGYGTESSRATLRHLESLGVDTVSLTPFGWMKSLSDTTVRGDHDGELSDGGEDRSALAGVVRQAETLGMQAILKPHIWIRGGAWRGEIEPREGDDAGWSTWWKSYREFILYYAEFAEHHGVETFVVGVELESAIAANPDQFRRMITDVRDAYRGDVTYSANWDESVPDEIWRDLDSVGVQFYPPLTDKKDPDVATLRREMRPLLAEWHDRAAELDLPLEITEVGYKSASSAVVHPSNWPQNTEGDDRDVDEQLQRRAYVALFAELARLPRLRSVSIWKYFTDPERDEGGPIGFSPRGKPAESVLRRAYRR